MEAPRGLLSRIGERVLTVVAIGLLILAGIAIWRMDPDTRWAIWAGIWKTLLWILVAAAVPWAARFFTGRLLAIGSNWAGAGLIAALTLVDAVLGLVLLGGWPSGGWGWIAAFAALGVAGSYNYLVAEYLAEQAGG